MVFIGFSGSWHLGTLSRKGSYTIKISVKGVRDMDITTTYIILYSIILLPIIITCISFVIYTLKKKKSNSKSKSKLPFIIGGISIGIFILFTLIGCIDAFLNMN